MAAMHNLILRGGTIADGSGDRLARATSPWTGASSPRSGASRGPPAASLPARPRLRGHGEVGDSGARARRGDGGAAGPAPARPAAAAATPSGTRRLSAGRRTPAVSRASRFVTRSVHCAPLRIPRANLWTKRDPNP